MTMIKILIALLVLVNPLTAVPMFLSLTSDNTRQERFQIARTATTAIFLAIVFFALFGNNLLKILGISIGAFQVGGGILVLLIAIAMMNAQEHPTKTKAEEHLEAETKASIAVVPLAIPLLIGPGSISTVIIYASSASSWWAIVQIIIAGGIVALLCLMAMLSADRISGFLGQTGINIINRVMGMLLAALSIEIIVAGIKALFPDLQ
ncbi:MAG: NAAT family transporter [Neisseriaceae bacterium]|nr:NAAT family transporter [Neisseriaceae bacterium]